MKFKDIFLVPNLITLSRLVIVIVIFFQSTPFDFEVINLIIFIAIVGLSDSLDGTVARRFNLVSKLGTILDPFTDRVVFILLLIWVRDFIPSYFLIGIIFREILILFGSLIVLFTKREIKVSNKGKVSTVLMFVIICLYVLNTDISIVFINELAIATLILYFYVAFEYLYNLIYKYG
ncbi:MAG: CDP-alcohol phosphatidyltransferase family protein [Candidatus Actinomarina sp.]